MVAFSGFDVGRLKDMVAVTERRRLVVSEMGDDDALEWWMREKERNELWELREEREREREGDELHNDELGLRIEGKDRCNLEREWEVAAIGEEDQRPER